MEQQLNEQSTVVQEETSKKGPIDQANLSKSKQMLKRYIAEMGSIKEGKGLSYPERPSHQSQIKIVAPKPVRARPLAVNHMTQFKWIETSPVKSENTDLSIAIQEEKSENISQETQLKVDALNKMPKLNFQIEQNLSYEDESLQIKSKGNNSPMSQLQSIMEAEQELNEIFSKSKNGRNNDFSSGSFRLAPPQWSPNKNCDSFQMDNLNSTNASQISQSTAGFSKFGHFKAPIKRPS